MIVVDGYNLIGQEAGHLSGLSLEKERDKLLRRLEQLAAVSGERFFVVFDGAMPARRNGRAERPMSGKSAVLVAFSKSGQTADAWILKYFSGRPKRSAILVSRDSELAQKVRKLGFGVEADLSRLETEAEPYIPQPLAPSQTGGGLLSSLSPKSREALAQARKKSKNT